MKCPNCGGIVHADEFFNTEYFDNAYHDTVKGACPDCGAVWQWTKVYPFERCEDVHQIEINDHF